MCDYSLHSVQNRLAVQGEHLIVHQFSNGSKGLAPDITSFEKQQAETKSSFWKKFFLLDTRPEPCAVCVPPGATLVLFNIPAHLRQNFSVGETERVTFTQVTAEPYAHRDAVRFVNGATVLLQRLEPGQRVTVVSLGDEMAQPDFDFRETVTLRRGR